MQIDRAKSENGKWGFFEFGEESSLAESTLGREVGEEMKNAKI
jgi:hypothetical protein